MPFDGSQTGAVTKLLISAREKICRGWVQGHFCMDDRVCMLGALGWRSDNPLCDDPIVSCAEDILSKVVISPDNCFFGYIPDISMWNDDKERTVEQVIDAFDKAIALSIYYK